MPEQKFRMCAVGRVEGGGFRRLVVSVLRSRCGVLAVMVAVTACGETGDDRAARSGERLLEPVEWRELFRIGGSIQDTVVFDPLILAAGGGHLYAFDYADSRLKAFGRDGTLRWSAGRHGHGPGEFVNVFDIDRHPDGALWVLDAGAGRIAVFGSDGSYVRGINLAGASPRDILPLAAEVLVNPVSPEPVFWASLDEDGRTGATMGFPADELAAADFLVRQTYSTVGADGATWASIFPLGDLFIVMDGRRVRCVGRLVEGEPLPTQVGPDPGVWAIGAVLADSSLYVLPRGRTEYRQRVLDRYSAENCEYRSSVPLPVPSRVRAVAHGDGTFYLYFDDPAPTIVAVRRD